MSRLLQFVIVLALLLPTGISAAPARHAQISSPTGLVPAASQAALTTDTTPVAAPEAPLVTTPDAVVTEDAASYMIAASRLWWHNFTPLDCDPDTHTKSMRDAVRRKAPQGSIIRTIYTQDTTGTTCTSLIRSNVAATADYVFWTTDSGLQRMDIAETEDAPVTITGSIKGATELQTSGNKVFALNANGLFEVTPDNNGGFNVVTRRQAAQVGANPHELRVDGYHVFWIANGQAKRFRLADSNQINIGPATGATAIAASFELCFFPPCNGPDYVYISYGRELRRYTITGALDTVLYSAANADFRVTEMLMVGIDIWFVEEQQGLCEPFCVYTSLLRKIPITGGAPVTLYFSPPQALLDTHAIDRLQLWDNYVYWEDARPDHAYGSVARLPVNADALTLTNMRVTKIEVTQGVQSLSNSVPVIRGKRTLVRVHVKSDGAAVPGVTLRLFHLNPQNLQVVGEPLSPINPAGQYLTVRPAPNRAVLDDAFLFELPMDWVKGGNGVFDNMLALRAEVNPYKYPPQQSYVNNIGNTLVSLATSPSLSIRFVLFQYKVGNDTMAPRYQEDFLQTLNFMRRTYPVATTSTWIGATGPGFHPGYTWVTDQDLRGYVDRSQCDADDDMCASDYVHGLLEDWDEEWNFDYAPMYGMMPGYFNPSDPSIYYFPRGSQRGDTANGPVGIPGGSLKWDTDGSYADWYAAHEIAHILGRDHPTPNGDPDVDDDTPVGCGHSQDDDDYPYPDALIGNGEPWGFDPGNGSPGTLPLVLTPTNNWDFMSYCNNQWISDYTFNGILSSISAVSSAGADGEPPPFRVAPEAIEQPGFTGDYWSVFGVLDPSKNEVKWVRARHKNGTVDFPVRLPGPYKMRQMSADGTLLGEHNVLMTTEDDGKRMSFTELFAYMQGVRRLELVRTADNMVLGAFYLSANAPILSNVRLIGAVPNPITGVVTLAWDASDADGDVLKFDVHYSRDDGAHWQPLLANVTGGQTEVDTALLGGSPTARFRVTASDGAHSTAAASPAYTVASKAPLVTISNPANDSVHPFGAVINFMGLVDDLQGTVPDNKIEWRNQKGPLGTGPILSLANLPVGKHTVTLRATNTAGQVGQDSISITIADNLARPGPTLAVGPVSVGFQFDENATQSQSASVTITNLGSGNLNWTASESAPWLSLSPAAGAAPATLSLTVNPNLAPDAGTVLADVLVKSGSQEMNVRVTASFGGAYVSSAPPEWRTFMPALLR